MSNTTTNPILISDDDDSDTGANLDPENAMQIDEQPSDPADPTPTPNLNNQLEPSQTPDYRSSSTGNTTTTTTPRSRTHNRELRHSALTILLDRELLTIKALGGDESIPQSRRRFTSKLLAPEDPRLAGDLRGDGFVLPVGGGSGGEVEGSVVRRGVVDVCEVGDGGWVKKASRSASRDSGGKKAGSSRFRSG